MSFNYILLLTFALSALVLQCSSTPLTHDSPDDFDADKVFDDLLTKLLIKRQRYLATRGLNSRADSTNVTSNTNTASSAVTSTEASTEATTVAPELPKCVTHECPVSTLPCWANCGHLYEAKAAKHTEFLECAAEHGSCNKARECVCEECSEVERDSYDPDNELDC